MLKQVESPVESPEALLRALELELASHRAKRTQSPQNRLLVLAGGLLLLVAGGAVALFLLFNMVSEMPRHQGTPVGEVPAETHP